MAKGFIFSIDAFVAFTFVLIVLHSLIFISAIPSTYYAGLMQASYLARDTLSALNSASASKTIDPGNNNSLLEYIVEHREDKDILRAYVGASIPDQYGYKLELWDSASKAWSGIYDSSDAANVPPYENHSKSYNKLKASAYSIFFGYDTDIGRGFRNPYCYITCNPSEYPSCPTVCDEPASNYEEGNATLGLVRLSIYR